MDKALFDITNLSVSTPQKRLLHIDKLTLPPNQLIALIGANGAGKSTLLHALLGQITGCTLSGDIICQGKPIATRLTQGDIAWVGQHEQFELPLTVLDYALLGKTPRLLWYQKPKSSDITQALDLLAQFDLTHLTHKRISHLSGGEKQRLAIVRALMQDTQILLLDEPTNHLDIKHERMLFGHLTDLVAHHGKSIVVVLHNLTHAHRYAHHIIAIHQGSVLSCGTPDHVMSDEVLHTLYDTKITRHHTTDGVLFV